MKYPKLRELKEALRSLFSKPYTTKFPAVEIEPVDGFRGKPKYFEEYCIGCGACAEVCPANAITVKDPEEPVDIDKNTPIRKIECRYDFCNFCGNCEAYCITEKGIQLTKEYDLALFDRNLAVESIDHELVICDICHSIITTKNHLTWLVRRLGTLGYGNPNLLIISQQELIPVETGENADQLRRPDMMKLLCPKCRHKIVINDIWR